MPWAGGSYTKANSATGGWTGDASLGVGVEPGRHDTQDNDFATGINQCLNKDGSNAMSGNLSMGGTNKVTNLASGTVATDAVNFGQLQAIIPTGTITAYGGATAPTGWLLCDGAARSRTTYSALWDVLRNGTASSPFGNGDGSTTFNIPNLQQRFPLGKATSGTGATLGGTGGAIDHTHTVDAHTHTINSHTHPLSDAGAAKISYTSTDTRMAQVGTASYNYTATTSPDVPWASSSASVSAGAGLIGATDGSGSLTSNTNTVGTTSGTNNPPFLVVNYIIKT